jgi:hypothetical protein
MRNHSSDLRHLDLSCAAILLFDLGPSGPRMEKGAAASGERSPTRLAGGYNFEVLL